MKVIKINVLDWYCWCLSGAVINCNIMRFFLFMFIVMVLFCFAVEYTIEIACFFLWWKSEMHVQIFDILYRSFWVTHIGAGGWWCKSRLIYYIN